MLQTKAHSTDQVYWVGPTQISYALVVMPAYHVGSSDPNLGTGMVIALILALSYRRVLNRETFSIQTSDNQSTVEDL